jgi:hypothetical protein
MTRGPLFTDGYRPQFSGHETFPLRYGWLKKVYDRVAATEDDPGNKSVFLDDASIARFGVGKNMVRSMRHWATAAGVITDAPSGQGIQPTAFGRRLFGKSGLDPFMEHPASLWLIHWHLASCPEKTTWFWAFNHYPAIDFDRRQIAKGLIRLASERGWSRVAETTIKNDVACFVRTYAADSAPGTAGPDDALESPLIELGLVRAVGSAFRFARGPQPTLGQGVFAFALLEFWRARFARTTTLSFEAIAHEAGSPGRIFLLDENDVADRLASIEDVTEGAIRWSETAGLKQVVRTDELSPETALAQIDRDFRRPLREAA